MKKVFISIATVISIITAIGLLGGCESTYKRQATITSVSGDLIQAQDTTGHYWLYHGEGQVGDEVTLIMNDNNTTGNITDDYIMEVK